MQSYGLHVARMAGLSDPVLARAAEIEAELSTQTNAQTKPPALPARKPPKPAGNELSLFGLTSE
jgi:DNA mismatch repair ATPase MutS